VELIYHVSIRGNYPNGRGVREAVLPLALLYGESTFPFE
jgi:hypothetical protein